MAGKHHDLVNFTKRYKAEKHEFYMDLAQWRRFNSRVNLPWQKVRFGEAHRASVPKDRGVYIFTVELAPTKLPSHGYIMYVGITGDDSEADLYKRYCQYLRHLKNQDGRPAVYYMLANWAEDLFFNYVALPNTAVDLRKIEKSIINAIIPPVNKRDLDAEITSAKAAAF